MNSEIVQRAVDSTTKAVSSKLSKGNKYKAVPEDAEEKDDSVRAK